MKSSIMASLFMKGDLHNPHDWEKIARRDLAAARRQDVSIDHSPVCYFAQQAVEKALKGWLVGQGWSLIKTHDLSRLALEVKLHGIDLTAHQAHLLRLSRLYFIDRYLDDSSEPEADAAEAIKLLATAEAVINTLFPPPPLPPVEHP